MSEGHSRRRRSGQIHFILSGAFKRARRLRWIAVNPVAYGEPPAAPKPNPRPPSAEEAAQIINESWKDPDWGTLVWLTMVTGLRRGELCAIRWRHVDLSVGVLHVERSIGQRDGRTWEKDIKTHQQRRITLDQETVTLLREHRGRCEARAASLGEILGKDAFVFSRAPDGSTHPLPNSITHRYALLARRLGIKTSLHKLRHYSATELIAGGVDIRTVAGRLGHGSGGVTTLRVYAAWVSESDQRAAGNLASRMPRRPAPASLPGEVIRFEASRPFEKVAVALRDLILDGSLPAGLPIPSIKELARDHGMSVWSAQRSVKLLSEWGLVEVRAGRPTLVRARVSPDDASGRRRPVSLDGKQPAVAVASTPMALDLEVRRLGQLVGTFRTEADPNDTAAMRRLLAHAVRRDGRDDSEIGDYELVVRLAGEPEALMTFIAS